MGGEVGSVFVRVSAETSGFDRGMTAVQGRLDSVGAKMATAGRAITASGRTLTATVTAPLVALSGLSLKAATDFESSFAGVRKTVDATEPAFQKLAQGFRDMAKEIPINVNELNAIGEAAGALGIKKENILEFTRVIADIGETTDLTSDQAADAFARIANVTGMSQKDFDRLGATIVDLGNKGASTESEITAMSLRIAGAGKQVGLTVPQIAGLASALASVGIEAEAGGTAISTTMVKIQAAINKGGEKLDLFAKTAGMSSAQFAKAWEKDAGRALVTFIEGLGRLKDEGGDVFGTLDKLGLGGIRVRDALLRASGAGDLFRQSLETAERAWRKNNALTAEAQKRYQTFASQLVTFRNKLIDVGITFGQALLPFASKALDMLEPFIARLGALATRFKEMGDAGQEHILRVAAALAALGPSLIVLGQVTKAIGMLTTAIGFLLTPAGLIAGAIVGIGAAILSATGGFDRIIPLFKTFADWVGDVGSLLAQGKIEQALHKIAGGISSVSQQIMSKLRTIDWGAVGRLIGDGVTRAVNAINWDAVFGTLAELGSALLSAIARVLAGINWAALSEAIVRGFGRMLVAAFKAGMTFAEGTIGAAAHDMGYKIGEFIAKGLGDALKLIVAAADKLLAVISTTLGALANIPGAGKMREWQRDIDGARESMRGWVGQLGTASGAADTAGGAVARAGNTIRTGFKAVELALSATASAVQRQFGSEIPGAVAAGAGKVQGQAGPFRTAGSALGKATVTGTTTALRPLGPAASQAVSRAAAAARGQAGAWASAGATLGSSLKNSAIAALGGLVSAVVAQVAAAISAARAAAQMGSPSKPMTEIGRSLGQGLIVGYLMGSASLPSTISESVQRALDTARAKVEAGMSRLSEAFGQLTSSALAGFDRITQEHLTTSEKALAELQAQHEAAARAQALADAQQALAAAQAAGDLAAIAAAQRQVNEAMYQDQVASLQASAAAERDAFEQERELQRRHLEERLAKLQESLEKHPEKHKEIQRKIKALLESFGLEYRQSGFNVGAAIAEGLRDSIGMVSSAATAVAQAIANALKSASPTKEGPMSNLDKWLQGFAPAYLKGLDADRIKRGLSAATAGVAVSPSGATMASTYVASAPAGGGGGGPTIVFNGPVYGMPDFERKVVEILGRRGYRNATVLTSGPVRA